MQNQVNMNQVNLNQVNVNVETGGSTNQPQFIIQGIPAIQGGVVNLTELLNKANAGRNPPRVPGSRLLASRGWNSARVFQGTARKPWPPARWTPTSSTRPW